MELNPYKKELLSKIVKEWKMVRDECEIPLKWDLGELLHGAPIPVGVPVNGKQLMWSFWEIASKPDMLSEIKGWVIRTIKEMKWEFDIIATLSYEISGIAALLSAELKKPIMAVDNRTYVMFPHDATNKRLDNKRILLLDSIVQSGVTTKTVMNNITAKGGGVIGCIVIALNDKIGAKEKITVLDSWCETRFLVYLHTFSQFYEVWRKSISQVSYKAEEK